MAALNVEIRFSLPNKGRGLFAVRDVSKGEVLFEEEPLVCAQFLWNAYYKYEACDYCLRSLESAEGAARRLTNTPGLELPHSNCCETDTTQHTHCPQCQVSYCSEECLQKAYNQYHQILCPGTATSHPAHPLNKLQEAWKSSHYPPETCSIMLLARIIATVIQSTDKPGMLERFTQFCKATVNQEQDIAHKLLGKQFQDQLETLRSLLTEALYSEDVQQWFSPEGFQSMFALIGTNGQGIGSSSISRWVANCEKLELSEEDKSALDVFIDQLYEDLENVSGPFLDCEGSGLYSLQSACNHSCEPNAEVTFPHNNSTLAVKSLSDIPAGQEVFISYLDVCQLTRSRHSRQKILRENYLFVCQCVKCEQQASDPDVTSDEDEDDDDMDDS